MTIVDKHPELIELLPNIKSYRSYSDKDRLIEAWEKDPETGEWRDVTLREQEKERLERELAKCRRVLEEDDEQ